MLPSTQLQDVKGASGVAFLVMKVKQTLMCAVSVPEKKTRSKLVEVEWSITMIFGKMYAGTLAHVVGLNIANKSVQIEIGRHAPSIFRDDNSFSSQMPWNITASVRSSQHGSSAASGLRGVANVSDPSASRGRDLSVSHLAGRGRSRNRLTSASPLASRGLPFDAEAFDNLTLPGNDDLDVLGDFDLSQYLLNELFSAAHGHTGDDGNASMYSRQVTLQDRLSKSSLDQESLNFLGFLTKKLEALPVEQTGKMDEDGSINSSSTYHVIKSIGFSALLPPAETSPSVATEGLMHILTLATKGFLSVRQDDYQDKSTRYHIRYEFGEIFLQLSEV